MSNTFGIRGVSYDMDWVLHSFVAGAAFSAGIFFRPIQFPQNGSKAFIVEAEAEDLTAFPAIQHMDVFG
jgi:hypothetical protein